MATRLFRLRFGATDTPGDLVNLRANPSGNSRYMTFLKEDGTAYQVPAGKTLYITASNYHGVAAGNLWNFGYGDDAVADGVAAPTNAKSVSVSIVVAVANTQYTLDVYAAIPALKYPYAFSSIGDNRINMYGIVI